MGRERDDIRSLRSLVASEGDRFGSRSYWRSASFYALYILRTTLARTSPVSLTPKCSLISSASPPRTSSPASKSSNANRMAHLPRSNAIHQLAVERARIKYLTRTIITKQVSRSAPTTYLTDLSPVIYLQADHDGSGPSYDSYSPRTMMGQ
jgi:hypothetical protein